MLTPRLYGIASRHSGYVCLSCVHRRLRTPRWCYRASSGSAAGQTKSDGSTNSLEQKEVAKQTDNPQHSNQAAIETGQDPSGGNRSPQEGLRNELRRRPEPLGLLRDTKSSAVELAAGRDGSQKPSEEPGRKKSLNNDSNPVGANEPPKKGSKPKNRLRRKANQKAGSQALRKAGRKDSKLGKLEAHDPRARIRRGKDMKGPESRTAQYTPPVTRSSTQAKSEAASAPQPSPRARRTLFGMGAKEASDGGAIEKLSAKSLNIQPVLLTDQPPVPTLSHGLDRVLFNPGVYHLQDPRSNVYNFDPYLQKIMPVSEFDFNALKQYVTSSEDRTLKSIAKSRGKKYSGSSSSMTAALSHFHFLLSHWRPINASMLSQAFPETLRSFTLLQRLPSAIFLRWHNGAYAIDADKEFDTANVLQMLGKSLEKLLTLPVEEFERYRKSNTEPVPETERTAPEAYHYSELGDFLMRSQLDAFDARLPGTGTFDLKTRAVLAIRMDVQNFWLNTGYQIRTRQGEFESFEREYFDMIRSAFLKYSLQVRMGRMDGIFVAFHNIERIFGFQYISLPEMDSAIHGTSETFLGDQEFRLSLALLNKVLDQATTKFPEQSLRIHFETRESDPPFLYTFAEPVTEEEITAIQTRKQHKIKEFERNILGLGRGAKDEQDSEDGSSDEASSADDWERIQAKVEEEIAQDERSVESSRKLGGEEPEPEVSPSNEAENDISPASFQDGNGDDREDGREAIRSSQQDDADKEAPESEADNATQGVDEKEAQDSAEDESNACLANGEQTEGKGLSEAPTEEHTGTAEGTQGLTGSEDQEGQSPPEPKKKKRPKKVKAEAKPEREILAMTLTIRNVVNGVYVARPKKLGKGDKWSVEYSLAQIPSNERSWSLYRACQARRQKGLEKEIEEQTNNPFIRNLRKLSASGRAWRKQEDDLNAAKGEVVFDRSSARGS